MARLICNECKERVAICDGCQGEFKIDNNVTCVDGKTHYCSECKELFVKDTTIVELD